MNTRTTLSTVCPTSIQAWVQTVAGFKVDQRVSKPEKESDSTAMPGKQGSDVNSKEKKKRYVEKIYASYITFN